MFQVEADKKWTWREIARQSFNLCLGWVGFLCWRLVTLAGELPDFVKGLLPPRRRRYREGADRSRTPVIVGDPPDRA